VSLPPDLDLSRFVNKATISRSIRKEFTAEVNRFYREPVLWSRSYYAITCGVPRYLLSSNTSAGKR
jgi:REP element-mobilizing transposase RayT